MNSDIDRVVAYHRSAIDLIVKRKRQIGKKPGPVVIPDSLEVCGISDSGIAGYLLIIIKLKGYLKGIGVNGKAEENNEKDNR